MKLVQKAAVAACLMIALSACQKWADSAASSDQAALAAASAAVSSQAASTTPVADDRIAEEPHRAALRQCGMFEAIPTEKEKTVQAIQSVLKSAQCLDRFISEYPESMQYWYAVQTRSAYLKAGLDALAGMDQTAGQGLQAESAAAAQRQLIEQKELASLKSRFKSLSEDALVSVTQAYVGITVLGLQSAGIALGDARAAFEKGARSQVPAGMIKEIVKVFLNGKMIKTWWLFGTDFSFAIDGYGMVEPSIRQKSSTNKEHLLSSDCRLLVRVAKQETEYGCIEYLDGSARVSDDMQAAVEADLLRLSKESKAR